MTTIPRCPDCREMLTASLSYCGNCGWRAAPEPVAAAPVRQPTPPRDLGPMVPIAVRLERIAELKRIVQRGAETPRHARRPPTGGYMREVTPEHGRMCTCEICFPKRMGGSRYRLAAESNAETPRTNGFAQRIVRHVSLADMTADELREHVRRTHDDWTEFAQQLERELIA